MKRQNNRIRCAVLILTFSLLAALLPVSGPGAQQAYAAGTDFVMKQGAVIIPVDFGNNTLTGGGVAFTSNAFGPQVQISEFFSDGRVDLRRYMLNDVYNRTGLNEKLKWADFSETATGIMYALAYPRVSVNTFLKNASYGKNVVSPIFLSNSAESGPNRPFVPFTVGTQEDLKAIKAASGADCVLDASVMAAYLEKALQMASEAKAFKKESLKSLPIIGSNYNLISADDPNQPIDHVVFLVNMSEGGKPNPQRYRAYAASGFGAGNHLGTLTMDTEDGKLDVFTYTVIPVDKDMPEKIIHETMHVKGVGDLYKEVADSTVPGGLRMVFPSGHWDVQGNHLSPSGPYYTQRRDMLIDNYGQAPQAEVQTKAMVIRRPGEKQWLPSKTHLHLNDINSVKKEAIVQHIEVTTEAGWLTDFYMEYRRPETDLTAKEGQKESADGFLLLYATEDSDEDQMYPGMPKRQYVRLLNVLNVTQLLENTAAGEPYPALLFIDKDGEAYSAQIDNTGKKPSLLVIPHDEDLDSELVKYEFGSKETGKLAYLDFGEGRKEKDGSLSYDMTVKLYSVSGEDFLP